MRQLEWWPAFLLLASPLQAQQRVSVTLRLAARPPVECEAGLLAVAPRCLVEQQPTAPMHSSFWAVAASALLPGSGQAMLSVNRAIPFVAVEAFAWTAYARNSQDSRHSRDRYRDLASRVARAPFSSVRPHGDFAYYERMTHYLEAGRYDLAPGGGLEPETDSATYNGAVWLLARRTYWANPSQMPDTASSEWKRAVAFYLSRAYDQAYRWSWTNTPAEYSAFLGFIRSSNAANRRAMQDLGVIIANHVLSTVDAYITVRLRRRADGQGFALEGVVPMARLSGSRSR